MALATFNGVGRIITLASGIPIASGTNFTDAESEMYSEWKRWAKLSDNAKFAPAFRTIGGDPLGVGVDAGAFFFLQNQVRGVATGGWAIKPPEHSGIFEIVGNIFAEDSDFTVFSGTTGAFTTQIRLTTSSLTQQVNVNEILSVLADSALTTATFDSSVTIDSANGVAGTAFPIGNTTNPVNNIDDALSIATGLNIRKYKIISPIAISGSHTNWTFEGEGDHTPLILISGSNFNNSIFRNVELTGDASGATLDAVQSILVDFNNFNGQYLSCGIGGNNIVSGGVSTFADCFSVIAGTGKPSIISSIGDNVNINVRGYNGGLEIAGLSHSADNISIDLSSGSILLTDTNVSGTIVIRGVGNLINNTGPGVLLVDSGLLNPDFISASTFDSVVSIDTTLPNSTSSGTDFPLGNRTTPVNNLTDARTIADNNNISTYSIRNALSLSTDHSNWEFRSETGFQSDSIDIAFGTDIAGSTFKDLNITGSGTGAFSANGCVITTFSGIDGTYKDCTFIGNNIVGGLSTTTTLFNCSAGGFSGATINYDGIGGVILGTQNLTGEWSLADINTAVPFPIIALMASNTGQLTLESTVVVGSITIAGDVEVTDNSGGGFIVTDSRLSRHIIDEIIPATTVSGSLGDFVKNKLLSVSKFLGLK